MPRFSMHSVSETTWPYKMKDELKKYHSIVYQLLGYKMYSKDADFR